jgi:membrane-anchored protein YejM (alkaline phosphatase superfamily)
VIAQWNYLPWAPITAKSFMRRLGVVSEQQVGLPDPRHAQLVPLQPLRCQSPHRPNVLMVVLESLRHDALTPQVMPNTAALASPRAYTSVTSAPATPPTLWTVRACCTASGGLLAKHAG